VQWLQQNRLQGEAWLALDDRYGLFTPYCENLIACQPQSGFDVEVSARLSSALQRERQRRGHEVDLLIE
jgi:hypothetical protein